MYADLPYARANGFHLFPVRGIEPALNCEEFESYLASSLRGKIPQVIET